MGIKLRSFSRALSSEHKLSLQADSKYLEGRAGVPKLFWIFPLLEQSGCLTSSEGWCVGERNWHPGPGIDPVTGKYR